MVEAKSLGEFGAGESAQGHVIDEHDQLDVRTGRPLIHAHWRVVGDNGDFRFEIESEIFVLNQRDPITRAEKSVGAALIDQRVGPERRRHFRSPRLSDELNVIYIGRTVGPMVGARQGRCAVALAKRKRLDRAGFNLTR